MKIIILFCLFVIVLNWLNFQTFRDAMQIKVKRTADAIKSIYSAKCSTTQFSCPVLSYDICTGTGVKKCMDNFVTPTCQVGKYSEVSGIKKSVFPLDSQLTQDTKFFICKTAQPQFQNALKATLNQNDGSYVWHYFGSHEGGSIRISPGSKYRVKEKSCQDHDSRLRPWYAKNIYNPKKIIILIENSKQMEQSYKFLSVKKILKTLISTAQPQDWFNIILFSDTAKAMFSQSQLKLVMLKDERAKYINSNRTFEDDLINNLTVSQSDEANYLGALDLATRILNNSKNKFNQYENMILMVTGFKPSSNYSLNTTTGINNLQQFLADKSSSSGYNMSYLFFGFGVEMADSLGKQILKNVSCAFNGIYFDIGSIMYQSEFFRQAKGYFDYLLYGNQFEDFKWTEIYWDNLGLGWMTTLAKPVYYQQSGIKRLIGVVGLDITLNQILSLNITKAQFQTNYVYKTSLPFKKNITPCFLETLRGNYKCNSKPQQKNCTSITFCQPKLKTSASVFTPPADTSTQVCCDEKKSNVPIIVGCVIGIGGAIILAILGFLGYKKWWKPRQSKYKQSNNDKKNQQLSASKLQIKQNAVNKQPNTWQQQRKNVMQSHPSQKRPNLYRQVQPSSPLKGRQQAWNEFDNPLFDNHIIENNQMKRQQASKIHQQQESGSNRVSKSNESKSNASIQSNNLHLLNSNSQIKIQQK